MKLSSLSLLCLSLLLFHTHFSLAKKGGISIKKSSGTKKTSTPNRGSTQSNSATNNRNNQGSSSPGGYPQQPGLPNQGGYPSQPGRPGYPPGGYPSHQYPAWGSPYGRHHGSYGSHGGYGGHGGHGGYRWGYGGYPGGYINQNPNNKVLSPRYGGSLGYGGHGVRGGSPFSHSVQSMGMYPSDKSRGFGRSAVVAAAGGAVAGMALGYGLGRFPRPPFQFHSRPEENYYNHYMYKKYGTKSTDTNDYSRDYKYSKIPQTYDSYMDSCMKRTDLLPVEKPKPISTSTQHSTTETNNPAAGNSSTSAPSTPRPLNRSEASSVPAASQALTKTATDDDDDDTVSIVEIGYPALIEQMKAVRCIELYMVYSEKYLKRTTGGVQGLQMGTQGLLAAVSSTILMLLNSNMLTLLH